MRNALFAIFPALFFCGNACAGDIFRCTATNGAVMYTNMACPNSSQVDHVASYTPEPPSRPESAADISARASAREARLAAEQARAAAQQAQFAAAQPREAAENSARYADESDDAISYYPAYYGYGSRSREHHHPQHTGGDGNHHSTHPAPHTVGNNSVAFHHR
jgi:Domain of unknown function (DUF4124)